MDRKAEMLRNLPKVDVTNQCTGDIRIPDQYRIVDAIPESIPTGGTVTIPALPGAGVYQLYETGDGTYLGFPRSLPVLGQSLLIGGAGMDTDASFDGGPVTVPMERELEGVRYPLVLCP